MGACTSCMQLWNRGYYRSAEALVRHPLRIRETIDFSMQKTNSPGVEPRNVPRPRGILKRRWVLFSSRRGESCQTPVKRSSRVEVPFWAASVQSRYFGRVASRFAASLPGGFQPPEPDTSNRPHLPAGALLRMPSRPRVIGAGGSNNLDAQGLSKQDLDLVLPHTQATRDAYKAGAEVRKFDSAKAQSRRREREEERFNPVDWSSRAKLPTIKCLYCGRRYTREDGSPEKCDDCLLAGATTKLGEPRPPPSDESPRAPSPSPPTEVSPLRSPAVCNCCLGTGRLVRGKCADLVWQGVVADVVRCTLCAQCSWFRSSASPGVGGLTGWTASTAPPASTIPKACTCPVPPKGTRLFGQLFERDAIDIYQTGWRRGPVHWQDCGFQTGWE